MAAWILIIVIISLIIFSVLCINVIIQARHPMLRIGQQAPDFILLDDQGKPWNLAMHRGTKMVLYFYPKDFSYGCTKEACSLRDNASIYTQNHITVVGISYDTPESHRTFKEAHHLPFTLVSDMNKEVSKRYGAYRSIISLLAPARITYLLDEDGKIIATFKNVNIKKHAEQILETFARHSK